MNRAETQLNPQRHCPRVPNALILHEKRKNEYFALFIIYCCTYIDRS